MAVLEAGRRVRSQPAPPHAVFEALTEPDRDPARPWLELRDGEQLPQLVQVDPPGLVIWSSLWASRPDALVRFDVAAECGGQGTELGWTLLLHPPPPDTTLITHMRQRLNQLINANLRYTFGQ